MVLSEFVGIDLLRYHAEAEGQSQVNWVVSWCSVWWLVYYEQRQLWTLMVTFISPDGNNWIVIGFLAAASCPVSLALSHLPIHLTKIRFTLLL